MSTDAGGTRGVSQLKILAELMHRLNFEEEEDRVLLPCDVFDMIGGSGSGGFIAILLVVLGLNAEQALGEFVELSANILEKHEMEAPARTAALGIYIDKLLKRYDIEKKARLLDTNVRSKGSKLAIPILHYRHIGHAHILRNFDVGQEDLNFTVAEAMLATLASPPLFTPASISKVEYISGDLKFSNPTLTIISEAYDTFGQEARAACVMNIGSGHAGFISPPSSSDLESWSQFLEKVVKDSEQKAEEIESQMGNLGLYHRFSVTRGLEEDTEATTPTVGAAIEYTAMYLTGVAVSRKLEICVDSLRLRDGVASLAQLKYSSGQDVLPPARPLPARTFVMRKKPWEFIEKAMLDARDLADADGPRMLVVTGMGGCGKTQLMLKFIQVHKNKFAAALFIDGSTVPRIRADTIRHVRSLGVAHSHKGFEDCLLFLAQPSPGPPRLILYDNVDDQDIDLGALLPLGESCAIVITSRNRSLGQLCPDAHLELDTMSMDEAVDLLLHHSGSSTVITEKMREEACAIARALGYLPIALTHARNYMFQTQCSGEEYLKRLHDNRDKLLAQPVKHHRDMRYVSTYAAFEASFVLLTLRCQQLLRLLSHFHWRDFPLDLVITAAKHNFSDYEHMYVEHGDGYYAGRAVLRSIFLLEDKWDITDLDEMMITLQNHSLLTLLPGAGTQLVQMHPVAHGWVKSRISEQDSETYESAAILLLALGSRWEYTPASQYLVSHITNMSSIWDELDINNAEAFGLILDHGGVYEDALRLRERVVKEVRGRAGQDTDVNGTSLWYLALTYRKMGRLKEAAVLQEEVLKLRQTRQGEMHPDTIMASNNLALTYRDLDRLKEAEVLQEQALKLSREVLGEMSPDTIKAANNLAFMYRDLGRLKEALVLQKEALKWGEEALGKMHPLTIGALNNLALAHRDLGLLEKAEEIQLNVVELTNKSVGPRHPQALWSSANLAGIHYSLGRLNEAHLRQEEVLRLRKEIIGEYHPNTINAAKNLAKTYCSLGRLNEAQELHEEVLRWREEALGDRHVATISARAYLAVTLFNLGKLSEAEALQAGVLAMRTEILGERHYKSAGAMLDLAETYHALGRKGEAIQLVTRATTIISDTLGDSHPMYGRCQHIMSHIQSEDDPSAYVSPASIVPSSSVKTVASSPDPEASSDHRHKRRRLLS